MPLSTDEQVNKTSAELVAQLHTIFGKHEGFRATHAKGILLKGTFTPSSTASALSTAPHFAAPSTPLVIRFSSSSGIPHIPDTDPNSNPRGIAIRFVLGEHKHTDIIAHSVNSFPVRTGEEFLAFLQNVATGTIGEWLKTHPKALRHVTTPVPSPASFATARYFGMHAFKLIDAAGKVTFIRYRIAPVALEDDLDAAALATKDDDFQYNEVTPRLAKGPIVFKLLAQVAIEGDVTDDVTEYWPDDREIVELGEVKVEELYPKEEAAAEMKKIIFDPVPRVEGVGSSDDPLVDIRAAVYLISGRERRAAKVLEA